MPRAVRRAHPWVHDRRGTTSQLESATRWRCGHPAAPKDAGTRPAARSPPGLWRRWRRATGNDEGGRCRALSGRREWREQPGARRELDERQPWTRRKITREQRKEDSGAPLPGAPNVGFRVPQTLEVRTLGCARRSLPYRSTSDPLVRTKMKMMNNTRDTRFILVRATVVV